jgi:hypothetical protein
MENRYHFSQIDGNIIKLFDRNGELIMSFGVAGEYLPEAAQISEEKLFIRTVGNRTLIVSGCPTSSRYQQQRPRPRRLREMARLNPGANPANPIASRPFFNHTTT